MHPAMQFPFRSSGLRRPPAVLAPARGPYGYRKAARKAPCLGMRPAGIEPAACGLKDRCPVDDTASAFA
jgi:hypothetical protein